MAVAGQAHQLRGQGAAGVITDAQVDLVVLGSPSTSGTTVTSSVITTVSSGSSIVAKSRGPGTPGRSSAPCSQLAGSENRSVPGPGLRPRSSCRRRPRRAGDEQGHQAGHRARASRTIRIVTPSSVPRTRSSRRSARYPRLGPARTGSTATASATSSGRASRASRCWYSRLNRTRRPSQTSPAGATPSAPTPSRAGPPRPRDHPGRGSGPAPPGTGTRPDHLRTGWCWPRCRPAGQERFRHRAGTRTPMATARSDGSSSEQDHTSKVDRTSSDRAVVVASNCCATFVADVPPSSLPDQYATPPLSATRPSRSRNCDRTDRFAGRRLAAVRQIGVRPRHRHELPAAS